MKKILTLAICSSFLFLSCSQSAEQQQGTDETAAVQQDQPATASGIENVDDPNSTPTVVKVAVSSKDHTTLVAALKAVDLVTSLANAGPFTVFAPVNAAFDKLPAGTVDNLLKPENKDQLATILQHHVTVSTFKAENVTDGQKLGMVDGTTVTIGLKDGKMTVDGHPVLASIQASNGIVHVIDAVLLPPSK